MRLADKCEPNLKFWPVMYAWSSYITSQRVSIVVDIGEGYIYRYSFLDFIGLKAIFD